MVKTWSTRMQLQKMHCGETEANEEKHLEHFCAYIPICHRKQSGMLLIKKELSCNYAETQKGPNLKGLLSKHRSIACPLPLALASDLPCGVCTCKWDLQLPSPVRLDWLSKAEGGSEWPPHWAIHVPVEPHWAIHFPVEKSALRKKPL